MVKAIFAIAGGVGFVAFMLSVFCALQMMNYRKPGVPGIWYAFNGYAFLTGRNFEPPAEPFRRLLAMCFAAFFAAIVIGMVFVTIYVNAPPEPVG